jgi:hypothetical protein
VAPAGRGAADSTLARYDSASRAWVPLASADCVSALPYQAGYLTALPADVDGACGNGSVVGFNASTGAFWARLDRDERLAIVAR